MTEPLDRATISAIISTVRERLVSAPRRIVHSSRSVYVKTSDLELSVLLAEIDRLTVESEGK